MLLTFLSFVEATYLRKSIVIKLIVEIKVVTNLNQKVIVEVKDVTNLFKLENPFIIKILLLFPKLKKF